MKKLLRCMLSVLLVLSLTVPAWALDVAGDTKLIPGFEEQTTGVNTSQTITTVTVSGTGLGLYPGEDGKPHYGYGYFGGQGSGFIVNNYIITAAHVVNPTNVVIRMPSGEQYNGPIVNVKDIQISVGGSPARVFSINVELDWAILVFDGPAPWFQNWTVKLTETYYYLLTIFGFVAQNNLHEGDMVVAVVRVRDAEGNRTLLSEVRIGKIIADKPVVPPGYEDNLPWFNLYDFTIDVELYPGDSGSPVIGFVDGVPYVIGIARAGAHINGVCYSYATRIDIVKIITDSVF